VFTAAAGIGDSRGSNATGGTESRALGEEERIEAERSLRREVAEG
jgi:hypothetical protein